MADEHAGAEVTWRSSRPYLVTVPAGTYPERHQAGEGEEVLLRSRDAIGATITVTVYPVAAPDGRYQAEAALTYRTAAGAVEVEYDAAESTAGPYVHLGDAASAAFTLAAHYLKNDLPFLWDGATTRPRRRST